MIYIHDLSPFLLQIGFLKIRYYSLAYILGIMIGGAYINFLLKKHILPVTKLHIEQLTIWVLFGIIIGGRLGFVMLYNLPYYLEDPIKILMIFQGGMSFYGGITGVILSTYIFSKKHNIRFLLLTDLIATAAPIGIFFGRIANFINGELYGRVTNGLWGVIFPSENILRHPTQLYEALFEGVIIFFILLYCIFKKCFLSHKGKTSSMFLFLYSIFRFTIEFFREPDSQIGFLLQYFTLGQLLCCGSCIVAIAVYLYSNKIRN